MATTTKNDESVALLYSVIDLRKVIDTMREKVKELRTEIDTDNKATLAAARKAREEYEYAAKLLVPTYNRYYVDCVAQRLRDGDRATRRSIREGLKGTELKDYTMCTFDKDERKFEYDMLIHFGEKCLNFPNWLKEEHDIEYASATCALRRLSTFIVPGDKSNYSSNYVSPERWMDMLDLQLVGLDDKTIYADSINYLELLFRLDQESTEAREVSVFSECV